MELKIKSVYPALFLLVLTLFSCSKETPSLYRIQENGKFGFINCNGEIIIKPQYKYVGNFNKDGYATVITDYRYKTEEYHNDILSKNVVDTLLYIKYGFIDTNNCLIVDTINNIYLTKMEMNLLGVGDVSQIVNCFLENKISFQENSYDKNLKLNSGLYPVQNPNNLKMGYMNLEGDTIIPTIYGYCSSFYNGVACVEKKNKMDEFDLRTLLNNKILIDSLGNEIISDGYLFIKNFTSGEKSWANKLDNDDEQKLTKFWFLLDKNGRICSDTIMGNDIFIYNSSSDLYVWELNFRIWGKHIDTYYSFIDKNGKFATDFNSDGQLSFSNEVFRDVTYMSEGLVGIKVQYEDSDAWAFADNNFEFKSQPFDSLLQFTDTLAAVKEFSKEGYSKWGFVNKNYEVVIPYKFDKVSSFNGELAYFSISNIEGYINRQGEVVWKTIRKQ